MTSAGHSSQKKTVGDLKKLAKQFSSYINHQYKETISYIPSSDKLSSVSVSKWLYMSKSFQDVTELKGFPFGNITCIYGKPDTGKTSMLMEAISQCQAQGILPILILTEHKFDFGRLSKFMGADPEAMLVFHADNLEQGYSYVEKILRDIKLGKITYEDNDKDVEVDVMDVDCFIFWDSIGGTMSESELESETEEWNKSMGKTAKAIKTLTKRVNLLVSKVRQRVGILLLNQSYMSMPAYGPSVEVPYGGDGVPYSSILVLRLKRIRDLKMTVNKKEVTVGLETKIEVKKNHITHKRLVGNLFTVACGMISASKESLEDYKNKYIK